MFENYKYCYLAEIDTLSATDTEKFNINYKVGSLFECQRRDKQTYNMFSVAIRSVALLLSVLVSEATSHHGFSFNKRTSSWFVYLETFGLNFSSLSFIIHVNLLHS